MGLPVPVSMVPEYPPVTKAPPAVMMSWYDPAPIAISATAAFCVSTEIGIFNFPRRDSSTGNSRANSSATGISADPGRVDSAPISTIFAPSRCIWSACSTACRTFRYFPPSEKLSGVTFRTPITSVLRPSTSVPRRILSRKIFRCVIWSMQCTVPAQRFAQKESRSENIHL